MCSSTMKDRAVLLTRPACSKNSNETSQPFWLILLSLLFLLPTSQLLSQREIGNYNTATRGDILSLVDECDVATSPGFGQTTVDGDISDWDLTDDFFANMYEAGNPTKDLLSKAYLRYNCETNTLCILVLMEPGQPADNSPSDSWMKIYDISNSVQIDGNSPDFALLPNQGGWEGCFSLAEGSYAEVEIHVNSNGRTSSTGKKAQGYKPLCIKCPDCPPAGQTCDDNDPTTENDVTDGECGCAGTPCTAEGKNCDDYDCNTNDYYDPSICDCVNEPIAPPSCDDHDECTTDYYDAENCQCVNEPIDDLNCGEGTIDCEGQTEAMYDPETERYTLYADGCWHDCLSPDRDVHFYQELCGDGELIAHVVSITGSGHAGVVMREGEDPVARRVGAMTKLYSNSVRREYRVEYGAPVHQMSAYRPGVEWFRMIRTGNQVKVYTSKRGNSWRLLYKVTYPNLAACLDVGLMAYSSSGGTDITAVFDNVQLIPAGGSNSSFNEIFEPANQAVQNQGQNTTVVDGLNPKVELLDGFDVNQKLQVFPNPAKGEAFVNLPAVEGDSQAVLSLFNSVGQEVLRRRVDTSISRTEVVQLSDLDPGVYVFRLQVKGQAPLTQRLVIGR